MISECEGTTWIGRPVEYLDAHVRFLDAPQAIEDDQLLRITSSRSRPNPSVEPPHA
jgi:hypothetical protein